MTDTTTAPALPTLDEIQRLDLLRNWAATQLADFVLDHPDAGSDELAWRMADYRRYRDQLAAAQAAYRVQMDAWRASRGLEVVR